jgi:hypothetical protein
MINSTLEIYQKQTNRKLEGLEKNVELILKILNKFVDDMEPEMDIVKTSLRNNREKQLEVKKDIETALIEMKFSVEDKVQEVQKTLENKELYVLPSKGGIAEKIKKLLNIK